MWVNNLVAKGPEGEVGSLRDEDELVRGWLADDATIHWPEAAQDAEKGGFPASVGSYDQEVLLYACYQACFFMIKGGGLRQV